MADQYVVIDSDSSSGPRPPLQPSDIRDRPTGPVPGGLPELPKSGGTMPLAMPSNMMPPGYKPPPSFQSSNGQQSNPSMPGQLSSAQQSRPVADGDASSRFPKMPSADLALPKQSFGPPGFAPPGSQTQMFRPPNSGPNQEQKPALPVQGDQPPLGFGPPGSQMPVFRPPNSGPVQEPKPSLPLQGDQQVPGLNQQKFGFMLPQQKSGPWIGPGSSQGLAPGNVVTGPPMPSSVKPESPDKPKFVPGWPAEESKSERPQNKLGVESGSGNPPFGPPTYVFKPSSGTSSSSQQSGGPFKPPVRQSAAAAEVSGKGTVSSVKPTRDPGLGKPALLIELESLTGLKDGYTDWVCPKCTLENPIEFYQCETCLEENKPLQKLLELVNKPGKLREKGKIGKGIDKVKGWWTSFTSEET